MKHSESLDQLATALAAAQGAMAGARKSSRNTFFKSDYADLASVWEAARKPLADNGLSVIQSGSCKVPSPPTTGTGNDITAVHLPSVIVTTMLLHSSGQWVSDELEMWPKDWTPQSIGTCIAYGRRYQLAAFVGGYQVDDDGETSSGRGETERFGTGTNELLGEVLEALKANDDGRLRAAWNDATATGTVGNVWQVLNTAQRSAARSSLQRTATTTTQQMTGDSNVEQSNA